MSKSVSDLWIYPIKSCRGLAVQAFSLDDRGPEMDRRWMLVEASGRFMTQREHPRMGLIDVALDGSSLLVSASGMGALSIDMNAASDTRQCIVWNDAVELETVSVDADRWFSDFLGVGCSLMRMPPSTERVVDRTYSPARRLVTLADGFPMLLIGMGSLEQLNEMLRTRGEAAVPMQRFRPNIVVSNTRPHEEDEWTSIRIGDVPCDVVKPCARCAITTVDPRTGVAGKEPLRTLSEYRKVGSKVMFGQNVIHAARGTIRLGDRVF